MNNHKYGETSKYSKLQPNKNTRKSKIKRQKV